MSSLQNLRELINERLTAAAEEIFRGFEKTIVQYEEEINHQRRLLENLWKPETHTTDPPQQKICKEEEEDNIWQPQITLHTTDLPQQHVCKEEEDLTEQDVCDQERNFSVDQKDSELSQMKKEEEEDLCNSVGGQQLVPNQKEESFVLVECKSKCEELLGENFLVSENTIGQYEKEIDHQPRLFNVNQKLQIKLHRIDLQQEHICMEQEVFTDRLLQKEERNFCLDQKYPERPQIKEAQEKLCIIWNNPEPPQTEEEQEHCTSLHQDDLEPPQIKERQELCSFQEGEQLGICTDQEGSKHPNSGSTNNLVLKETHDINSSHSSNVDSSSMSRIRRDADTRKKAHTCDVCGKVFKHKSNFTIHYRIHTGEKPFFCETCGKGFNQRHHVTSHMRTHTDEKLYFCQVCGKKFDDLAALQLHRAIQKDHNLFSCKICEKTFTHHSSLKEHMKVHRGEMPFSCEICEKSFTRQSRLKEHMVVHTGERPHSCAVCGQKFIKNSHLKGHMRIHTGEMPYSCDTCKKTFRYRRSLFCHMRVHIEEKPGLTNTGEII